MGRQSSHKPSTTHTKKQKTAEFSKINILSCFSRQDKNKSSLPLLDSHIQMLNTCNNLPIMEKPATTDLDIHPIIKKRWSPRSFKPTLPVEKEKLRRVFEAARWAPSSFNEQPWRFIVGLKGDATWGKLFGTLAEFNQKWAHLAPVLVLTLGKKTYAKNGNPNMVHKYDLGASAAYMTFQAYSEGLVMHQMGGFSKEKAVEAFAVPEDYEPVSAIAIGYQDRPEMLIPEMEESERAARQRQEIEKMVFSDTFGQPATMVLRNK